MRPRLGLALAGPMRATRIGRCLAGDLRARLTGADRRRLERADFLVGARRVARQGRPPFARTISRERVRRGRRVRLRVRALLRDGRVVTLDRRMVWCR